MPASSASLPLKAQAPVSVAPAGSSFSGAQGCPGAPGAPVAPLQMSLAEAGTPSTSAVTPPRSVHLVVRGAIVVNLTLLPPSPGAPAPPGAPWVALCSRRSLSAGGSSGAGGTAGGVGFDQRQHLRFGQPFGGFLRRLRGRKRAPAEGHCQRQDGDHEACRSQPFPDFVNYLSAPLLAPPAPRPWLFKSFPRL